MKGRHAAKHPGFMFLAIFLPTALSSPAPLHADGAGSGFAVVELFTSEGCSSCPPADEALSRLVRSAQEKKLPADGAKRPKVRSTIISPGARSRSPEKQFCLPGETLAERIHVHLVKKQNAAEAVRTFVNRMSFFVMASGSSSGGPLTVIASETATTNRKLNTFCREAYALIGEAFKDKLRDYGFPEAEAAALATGITAAVEGGIILSRTYHSRKPLRTIARLLGEMVQAVDPGSAHSLTLAR